jgi:acetyl coenzyme A synthetase (ADP forming)-like protein
VYDVDVVLADGSSAHVRRLRLGDQRALSELYHGSSDESRYLRFFSPVSVAAAIRVGEQCIDGERSFALVAEIDDHVVAMAEYELTNDEGTLAEAAFMVHDDWQGCGLGTLLLEQLARAARARGVRRFRASFLLENQQMREVFRDAGFVTSWSRAQNNVCEATLELEPTEEWRRARRAREHTAEARSMARLLAPSSIAVVGAGRSADSIGNAIVRNLVAGEFAGAVYPVNPHAADVAGLPAFPSVADLPAPIDLAVIAVPAAAVTEVVHACGTQGARGVVVVSGGFAELPGGDAVQRELVSVARGHGMRLVGPNCVGVLNTHPEVRMNATFSPVPAERGRVGFASQSGGVGIELLARAHALGLGISTFVSIGNKADVSTNDLLQYWADDPDTDVVLLYLESFGNPRKFARLARELSHRKPIIAMKSGRTPAGARGARSHTAALADLDVAVDEIFRATGVIRVDTLEEMFDTASLLVHQPIPRGRRAAIMSNGGGPGILAADACVAGGLEIAPLSDASQQQLRALTPAGASVQNPVDLIAAASADVYRESARVVLESGEVDALLVLYVTPQVTQPEDVETAVVDIAAESGDIPVIACFLGLPRRLAPLAVASRSAFVPVFEYPESAAGALARAVRLGEWRRRRRGSSPTPTVDHVRAQQRIAAELTRHAEGGWVAHDVANAILTDYGIPVLATVHATTAELAVAAAEELGYPVALKAASPTLIHKSDAGGVALDLATADAVHAAFERMQEALGDEVMGGAVVQPMITPGVELLAGITHDPQFGPLMVFGAGGTAAELQRDTVLRIPPLTDVDIDEMLHGLRTSPLLFGYRNAPPTDISTLADVLGRLGRLADDLPEIADLDCNPLVASPTGVVALDVKLRIAPDREPRSAFDIDEIETRTP